MIYVSAYTDQLQTKTVCVKALINLLADNAFHKSLVKDDIIWGLANLSLVHPSKEALLSAYPKELEELSSVQPHEINYEAKYHYYPKEYKDIVLLCTNALCYLSIEFANEMVDVGVAVKTVFNAIMKDDTLLQKLGARCLTNMLMKRTTNCDHFRRSAVENLVKLQKNQDEEICEMYIIILCLTSQSECCRKLIAELGMLQSIEPANISRFDSQVTLAYLTMFTNIANNPAMRMKLLDDNFVQRFSYVCKAGNHVLGMFSKFSNKPNICFALSNIYPCMCLY